MKLYVYMVLCGSICTLLYFVLNCFPRWELPLAYKRTFLRMNMVLYLFPIPWLFAKVYEIGKYVLEKAGMTFQERIFSNTLELNNPWESYLFYDGHNRLVLLSGYKYLLPVFLGGATVYLVWAGFWLIRYLEVCSTYKKDAEFLDKSSYIKDVKLREKISIAVSPRISSPAVVGVRKPLILLPTYQDGYEKGMIGVIHHELRHVEGRDIMVRICLSVIRAVEWFNPFVHYLIKEELTVSEMICDEAAVKGMSKEEKMDYMRCVLEAAQGRENRRVASANLGTRKGQLTKRIERMLGNNKKKTWKKGIAVVITMVSFLISVIPAYAYRPPVKVTMLEEDYNVETEGEESDWLVFKNAEESGEIYLDFSRSDFLFVSEDDIAYSINENQTDNIESICTHNYVTGTAAQHFKESDGGCRLTAYNAQRCTKCGDIVVGAMISETNYVVCPH